MWALPGIREQLARLSVHVEIASLLNKTIDSRRLVDLGKLEQDLVFGDATSKEVINFLSSFADLTTEDKVRSFPNPPTRCRWGGCPRLLYHQRDTMLQGDIMLQRDIMLHRDIMLQRDIILQIVIMLHKHEVETVT